MIKTCEYCTKEFECKNKRAIYCSSACRTSACRIRRNAKRPLQNCPWCTKEFQPKWGNQQYCTPLCASFGVNNRPEVAAKKSKVLRENGNLKGEKNPSYGKSPSQEIKDKISKGVANYYEDRDNPFKGKAIQTNVKIGCHKSV